MTEQDDKERIKELESQIAELKAAMIILQRRVDPPPRPAEIAQMQHGLSRTEQLAIDRASIPIDDLRAMEKAVPTAMVRDIVRTAKR